MPQLSMRICRICKQEKAATLDNFYKHPACKDGIGIYCKPCQHKKARDWRRKNNEKFNAQRRIDYSDGYKERHKELIAIRAKREPFLHTAESIRSNINVRSRKKGLPVADDLRNKHFIAAWLERQQTCECCGVKFLFGRKGTVRDNSPSLDRMIPHVGYELENVSLICWKCNNIKRNFEAREIRRVADWIDRRSLLKKLSVDGFRCDAIKHGVDRESIFAACRAQCGLWVDRTHMNRMKEKVGAA